MSEFSYLLSCRPLWMVEKNVELAEDLFSSPIEVFFQNLSVLQRIKQENICLSI